MRDVRVHERVTGLEIKTFSVFKKTKFYHICFPFVFYFPFFFFPKESLGQKEPEPRY